MLIRAALLALLLVLPHRAVLAATDACPTQPADPTQVDLRPQPVAEPGWQERMDALDQQLVHTDLSQVQTLFLGDSLTEAWPAVVFDHFYSHRAALNLGVRSDNTQGLMWRLARLPLGTALRPRLIVLLIGTNNLWPGANPGNVAAGIDQVVQMLRQRSPQSQILLVGLLPRGESPTDPFRTLRTSINGLIATCAGPGVTFVDPGGLLLDGYGRLSKDISFDALHLTWIGYAILGTALEPSIHRILGN
jgi:lysophospholipase L1-like esterase